MIISDEGQMSAACRMKSAAEEMSRAADRIESAVRRFEVLLEDGYGNNACRLIELLENIPEKP